MFLKRKKKKVNTWRALKLEKLKSTLSPDLACLFLCNLNIVFWFLSFSLIIGVHINQLLTLSLSHQFKHKIHHLLNHHYQFTTNQVMCVRVRERERERERAFASWSLLWRVLFYFPPLAFHREEWERDCVCLCVSVSEWAPNK